MATSAPARKTSRYRAATREQVPFVLLLAFCIYVLAWFWQISHRIGLLDVVNFELVLGTILAIVSVAMIAARPPKLGVESRTLIAMAVVLFLFISLRVVGSPDPTTAWQIYVERVVKFSFWAVFIVAFLRTERDLRWFVGAFLLATGYICFESVRGGLFGGLMWQNQGVMRLHGSTPLFAHPNSLAGLALGVVPFAYYLISIVNKKWLRFVLAALIIMALWCVLLTGSRTAYVGIFGLAGFIVLRGRWPKKRLFAGLIAALVVAVVIVPAEYKARFETIFTGQEIEGDSMGKRRVILEDSLAILAEHPLGVGVAGFQTVREQMFGRSQDTHNLYLQVATQLGIPGLLVFLGFLWTLWHRLSAIAEWRAAEPASADAVDVGWIRVVARATQAYLSIRIVLGLFGHDLYEVYWWLALGLALSLTGMTAGVHTHRIRDPSSAPALKSLRRSARVTRIESSDGRPSKAQPRR